MFLVFSALQPHEHGGQQADDELDIERQFVEWVWIGHGRLLVDLSERRKTMTAHCRKASRKSQKVAKCQEQAPGTLNDNRWILALPNRSFQHRRKRAIYDCPKTMISCEFTQEKRRIHVESCSETYGS